MVLNSVTEDANSKAENHFDVSLFFTIPYNRSTLLTLPVKSLLQVSLPSGSPNPIPALHHQWNDLSKMPLSFW